MIKLFKDFYFKNLNTSVTVISKFSEIILKSVLLFLLIIYNKEHLIQYTYFLALSSILGSIIDFGNSRIQIRKYKTSNKLEFNSSIVVIPVITTIGIISTDIKYYDYYFLGLATLYAVLIAIRIVIIKYFEYSNSNKTFHSISLKVNLISYFLMISVYLITQSLHYLYLIQIISIVLTILWTSKKLPETQFIFDLKELIRGTLFLFNNLGSLAFSQILIVIVNNVARTNEIANFVITQKIIDISLTAPNAITSGNIGLFFQLKDSLRNLIKPALKIWGLGAILLVTASLFISISTQEYKMIFYLCCLYLPTSLAKTISPYYSIIIDYTERYYLRTIALITIILLQVIFIPIFYKLFKIYGVIIIINLLMLGLLTYYIQVFKRFKIYEKFHN